MNKLKIAIAGCAFALAIGGVFATRAYAERKHAFDVTGAKWYNPGSGCVQIFNADCTTIPCTTTNTGTACTVNGFEIFASQTNCQNTTHTLYKP